MTTGSVRASEQERRLFAQRTRWWNSTGGGSKQSATSNARGVGAIKAGDGGAKFRAEWPDVDAENYKWMREKKINFATGLPLAASSQQPCSSQAAALRRRPGGSIAGVGTVVQDAQVAREAGQSWLSRNKWKLVLGAFFSYILVARLLGDGAVA